MFMFSCQENVTFCHQQMLIPLTIESYETENTVELDRKQIALFPLKIGIKLKKLLQM